MRAFIRGLQSVGLQRPNADQAAVVVCSGSATVSSVDRSNRLEARSKSRAGSIDLRAALTAANGRIRTISMDSRQPVVDLSTDFR